jgi:hypothetical protein
MSRGISASQREILTTIRDGKNPDKGLSLKDIMPMLADGKDLTNPYWIEKVGWRTNRTLLKLQRRGLIRCASWCKTMGSYEYDTERYFSLTLKGMYAINTPLRDAATRSRDYRKRKRVVSNASRQAWLADVMLFSRRNQCL